MTSIHDIRGVVQGEVLDYQQLTGFLDGYASPRDKIGAMLRAGDIVRIKKGLYVFGEDIRRGPWSREILANLVYGPSYISLDYALSYYGLIPERVETMTSVTSSRTRRFETPLGVFTYSSVASRKYSIGVDQQRLGPNQHFLIATPAKALADKIWADRRFMPRKAGDFETYLHHDLRITPDGLSRIDRALVDAIAAQCGSRKIRFLAGYLRQFDEAWS